MRLLLSLPLLVGFTALGTSLPLPAAAVFIVDNGAVNLTSTLVFPPGEDIEVRDAAGGATTTLIVDDFSVNRVDGFDSSIVELTNLGYLISLTLGDTGQLNVAPGATALFWGISGDAIGSWAGFSSSGGATGNASLTVSGGSIADFFAFGTAFVDVIGGDIGSSATATVAQQARLDIRGGIFETQLFIQDDGTVNWSGGGFGEVGDGDCPGNEDGACRIFLSDSGLMRVVGSDFAVDGTPVGFGPLAPDAAERVLSGTLEDGSPFAVPFRYSSASARLLLVPEPATAVLLGLGLIGLAARGRVARVAASRLSSRSTSHAMRLLFLALGFAALGTLLPLPAAALFIVDNGAVNQTSTLGAPLGDDVEVRDAAGGATTTLIVDDSSVDRVDGFDSSIVELTNLGYLIGLIVTDEGQLTVAPGADALFWSVRGNATGAWAGGSSSGGASDSSTLTVTGGTIDNFGVGDFAFAEVLGGTIGRSSEARVTEQGRLDILGGLFETLLFVQDDGIVNWSGGGFGEVGDGDCPQNSDGICKIFLEDSGLLRVVGSSFAIDGVPVGFGPVAPNAAQRVLSGTLEDGSPFAVPFRYSSASARLLLVPEPATALLLGLGLLGLAARGRAAQLPR